MTKKEKILLAAQEEFGKNGYTATTLKIVADKANVASGLVSHYFGNKDNLFLEAGGDLIDNILKELKPKTNEAKNGLHAVEIFVHNYFHFTERNKQTFPTLLRCSPFSDEYPGLDRVNIAAKFKLIIAQLENYIEQGIEDGSIRKLPVEQTAYLIYGHIVGSVRTVFLTPYKVEGLFEEACQFIVRSLKKE